MTDSFSQADGANRLANVIRPGTVTEIQLGRPAKVRVEIEDGWVSDFVPVFQLAAGRVRSWSAPKSGEQVVLLAPSGEMTTAMALRGLGYGDFLATQAGELITVLGEWDDGAVETYDEADHVRRLELPAGGKLEVTSGAMTASFAEDAISLKVGSAELKIAGGSITLTGNVNLGGEGGLPVARNTDAVVSGKVVATSAKVRAV